VSVAFSKSGLSRGVAAGVAGAMVLASALVIAGPAQAFTDFTVDGILYESEDAGVVTAADYDDRDSAVTIPDSVMHDGDTYLVTAIGDYAFDDGSIEALTFGENVTEIGSYAFAGNHIAELSLGSVTTVGQKAFESNLLTSVVFPASVTFVGIGAFNDNPLESAIFNGAAPTISHADSRIPSLGSTDGLTVHYLTQFAAEDEAEGFTTPTWMGYATARDSIVSFDLGPHGSVDSQRVEPGSTAMEPTSPMATNMTFAGWFSDDAFTTVFDFAVAPTENVTLFAKWTAVAPNLALDLGLSMGDSAAGATVAGSGAGLEPESEYDVVVRSTPSTIAFGSVNADGTFATAGLMPAGLAAGAHTVTLNGTAADGSAVTRMAYFTINSAGEVTYVSYTEAEAVTATEAVLASTGVDGAPLGFAALLLLLAGAALVVGRRRSVA